MNLDYNVISFGKNNLKISHLLIIGILTLSFSISFLIKIIPGNFGWELHEFDPFFNYRATEFIVNNGINAYFNWNDDLSWYPYGRDISSNSQVMLHITAAVTYWIFGNGIELYDYTIIFPVVIGSLTTFVIFALVRVIGGTTAGLFASILFSISLPILIRGSLGWFKSEPLGLFYGLIFCYLFLSGIKTKNKKIAFSKIIFSAIFCIMGISAWGGNQFFLIPIGLMLIGLPFVRSDDKFLIMTIPTFTISLILFSLLFERPGLEFIYGLGGLTIIFPTIIMIILFFIKSKSPKIKKNKHMLIFIALIFILALTIISFNDSFNLISLPTHRYLNAVFPILTTTDPLTDSVSEHATLNISQSFTFHSVLLLFSSIGAWLLLKNTKKSNLISNDMKIFVLVIGFFGVYISSAFMRLEVFASISIILLSSIGLSILIKNSNIRQNKKSNFKKSYIQYTIFSGIIILLIIPLFVPFTQNAIAIGYSSPAVILNGGTNFPVATNDWIETLEWIEKNTPEKSVIASWWDYGYWIQTVGNRPSLADNSTLIDHRIKSIAKIMFEYPGNAWKSFHELEADYFVLFISSERLEYSNSDGERFYVLGGGGDESKKYWIASIADIPLSQYLHDDRFSGTSLFWDNTFFGKATPYQLVGYVNFQTDQISDDYVSGWTGVYHFTNKFDDENSPFKLVYSSPSLNNDNPGPVIGVLVYEINDEYIPFN